MKHLLSKYRFIEANGYTFVEHQGKLYQMVNTNGVYLEAVEVVFYTPSQPKEDDRTR